MVHQVVCRHHPEGHLASDCRIIGLPLVKGEDGVRPIGLAELWVKLPMGVAYDECAHDLRMLLEARFEQF